jgi:Ferritin-like domain
MARNRITWTGATLALLLIGGILAGCGGGGSSTATGTDAASTQPSADATILNAVLARQEDAADAYSKVIPELSPALGRRALYFRRQEQEHIDATIKAMRGLKIPAEPNLESIEPGELESDREVLVFLYEVESATIDEELSAISNLEASWPRSLLASTVADQAQHLTLLRQALGAGPLASVPVPFENGTAEAPAE